MGTCFPNVLLGEQGYLVAHQHRIRKLSLITEGDCFFRTPLLKEFSSLRELSWKGVLSDSDCDALKAFLELHHERLVSLEVDFINWTEVVERFNIPFEDDDEDESTPLTDLILPMRKNEYEGFLPNLQTLSLSAASFKGSRDCLINAFNFHSVKELRLINCEFAVELLDYMARTNQYLNAAKAELVLSEDEMIEFNVIDFLGPFDGLEDLFLMFESVDADQYYAQMILRHRDTLRRLVYHRRHYCVAKNSPYSQEYCDSSLEDTECGGFAEIVRETKLESAGVCAEPSKLQKSLQGIASRVDSLKLLHLRFTGKAERKPKFFKESEASDGDSPSSESQSSESTPSRRSQSPSETEFRIRWEQIQGENWRNDEEEELEAFANWAFGPNGFPRLQVLASGDFSYGNRFMDTHRLWCRDTRGSGEKKTWRTVRQSDIAENELIDVNRDMMSACPVSPLFYRYGLSFDFPGIS